MNEHEPVTSSRIHPLWEEFKKELEDRGVTDPEQQHLHMALFVHSVIDAVVKRGIYTGDPIEVVSSELIALDVPEDERKAILHRLYQDLEDPRQIT